MDTNTDAKGFCPRGTIDGSLARSAWEGILKRIRPVGTV